MRREKGFLYGEQAVPERKGDSEKQKREACWQPGISQEWKVLKTCQMEFVQKNHPKS